MKKILIAIILLGGVFFLYRALSPKEEPPKAAANIAPASPKGIPQKEAISGSSLNKAFPEAAGDFKIVFTQEKDGFAQADLTKAGVIDGRALHLRHRRQPVRARQV